MLINRNISLIFLFHFHCDTLRLLSKCLSIVKKSRKGRKTRNVSIDKDPVMASIATQEKRCFLEHDHYNDTMDEYHRFILRVLGEPLMCLGLYTI